jgi:hypothetical protein
MEADPTLALLSFRSQPLAEDHAAWSTKIGRSHDYATQGAAGCRGQSPNPSNSNLIPACSCRAPNRFPLVISH